MSPARLELPLSNCPIAKNVLIISKQISLAGLVYLEAPVTDGEFTPVRVFTFDQPPPNATNTTCVSKNEALCAECQRMILATYPAGAVMDLLLLEAD